MKIKTEKISLSLLNLKEIELFIKRIDLLDPLISGNKFFKLKYNMLEAKRQKKIHINIWWAIQIILHNHLLLINLDLKVLELLEERSLLI